VLVVALAFETLPDVCAYADELAVASISHSGAIASIKPAILKEAVCFLLVTQMLVTQIGNFSAQPPESSYISKERGRRADGGGWVLASGDRAMPTSAFRVRYAQRDDSTLSRTLRSGAHHTR